MRPSFGNVRNTFRDVAATYIPLCKSIQTSRTLAEIGSRHRSTIALTGLSFNIYISSPEAVAACTPSKRVGILLIPVTHTHTLKTLKKYFKKRQYDRVPIAQLKRKKKYIFWQKFWFVVKDVLLRYPWMFFCICFSQYHESLLHELTSVITCKTFTMLITSNSWFVDTLTLLTFGTGVLHLSFSTPCT